jgi:hypothetical protein
MANFFEDWQVVGAAVPADVCVGGCATSDYVSLKGYERLVILFYKAAGTAGDDPTITLDQATAVAGTGTKVLTVVDKYWVKTGAALNAIGTFTKTTQTAATTVAGSATSAEEQAIYGIEITPDQLDVGGGFDCVRATVADPGNAGTQYGCLLYLLGKPRYAADVAPSAIVD